MRRPAFFACALLLLSRLAAAQAAFDGPPAPTLPDTEARDTSGHVTVRAVRLRAPIRVDGRLDEEIYRELRPITGLIQSEPNAGAPFTEKTEAWVLFDAKTVYVSIRFWRT